MREFKSLQNGEPKFDIESMGDNPVVTVQESETSITITYNFLGFYLSDDTRKVRGEKIQFEQVNIPHTGFLAESGKPLLPSFGRYVQIPSGVDYSVTVKHGEPVKFDGILVLPAQEQVVDQEIDTESELTKFEYDTEFYQKDVAYPKDVVEVTGPYVIKGNNALLVHVRPLQYNPKKKNLTGYSTISITIEFEKGSPAYKTTDIDDYTSGEASPFFLNVRPPKPFPGPSPVPVPPPPEPEEPEEYQKEFLIIYHDTLKKAAHTLAVWKSMRGIPTDTVPVTDIGVTVDDIKEYIRKRRNPKKSVLRYVLLLGDVELIPSEKITGSPAGHNITDYYYSTPKDPHNTEYVFPWLAVGRIPVHTLEEAESVVQKIITYEKDPPENPEYYHRMVFAAYFQDKRPRDGQADRAYMKTMETIRKRMVALGYTVDRVYVSSNPDVVSYIDGVPVPEPVKKIIADENLATDTLISSVFTGCLIIGHRDHGARSGWVHPKFKLNHLDKITGGTPSIFYSVNCLTGRFDLKEPRDSFAEKILKMDGGAPSVIAATRPSHTWLNDDLMKALFDAVWAGVLPLFPDAAGSYSVKCNRLGDILNYAKLYLPVTMSGSLQFVKDHFEIYHVIGDPTLEVWTRPPTEIELRVLETQGYLDIFLPGCPRECVITIWDNTTLVTRVEPVSSHVRVSLGKTPATDISVCFWAPGYKFKKVEISS
ncbi:MAG: C25 family cysteine peptidase [Candidatus Methanofastidiosia archaeon]|jgi:hypothetical protein